MKTQTILDEFGEKLDKTTSFGGFEVEYAGCDDPCCGGCTEKLDEDKMIAFLKEKLEKVERKNKYLSIEHTFYRLYRKGKINYCIHDIEDNCFQSIEDIRKTVEYIVDKEVKKARESKSHYDKI